MTTIDMIHFNAGRFHAHPAIRADRSGQPAAVFLNRSQPVPALQWRHAARGSRPSHSVTARTTDMILRPSLYRPATRDWAIRGGPCLHQQPRLDADGGLFHRQAWTMPHERQNANWIRSSASATSKRWTAQRQRCWTGWRYSIAACSPSTNRCCSSCRRYWLARLLPPCGERSAVPDGLAARGPLLQSGALEREELNHSTGQPAGHHAKVHQHAVGGAMVSTELRGVAKHGFPSTDGTTQ